MSRERDLIAAIFGETSQLHQAVGRERASEILRAAETMVGALKQGGKVLVFGNGGSAADSQHFAAELVGRFVRERRALPAMALTTDTSVLTSIGNDYDFDRVFSRQIEALGARGDVALGISTSGASRNVIVALAAAREKGMTTVALTGRDGGAIGAMVDIHLNVPAASTARVQEVHRTVLHVVCELIERRLEDGTL
jgi:D-sedoheptulose 7-phosphate isomerase